MLDRIPPSLLSADQNNILADGPFRIRFVCNDCGTPLMEHEGFLECDDCLYKNDYPERKK